MTPVRAEAATAVRDAVPFLVITVVWLVVTFALYGLFLVTKPDIDYAPWVHVAVAVPGLIGYVGHTLRQVLSVLTE